MYGTIAWIEFNPDLHHSEFKVWGEECQVYRQ